MAYCWSMERSSLVFTRRTEWIRKSRTIRTRFTSFLSGSGFFTHGETREPFEPGEALFVPAGDTHRFEDFSDDFAAWVVFYGPKGGEKLTK